MAIMATGFILDRKLDQDTESVMWLGLCEVRLMCDMRWPWLVLVPQRPGIEEIHELTPLDQAMLTFEIGLVAQALKTVTGCDKINVGALGNIVRQLHVHVIARDEGDPAWPGPVWGVEGRKAWTAEKKHAFLDQLRSHV